MIHFEKFREVGPGDFTSKVLAFLKDKAQRTEFTANLNAFNKWLSKRGKKKVDPPVDPGATGVGAAWHDEEAITDEEQGDQEEGGKSPKGKQLFSRLEGLRKQLAAAEKEAEDYQAERRAHRGRSEKGKDKRKRKEDKDKKSREDTEDEGRKKAKKRKKRTSEGSKEAPKKKKKKKRDTSSTDGYEDKKGKPLFGSSSKKKRSEAPEAGDRGPFGEGPAVAYSGASSSEETVFRDAPSKSMKSSQLRLLNYSRKYPGRLASRLLLKMQEAVARGFEGAKETKTPPVAMNHVLTVMQPALQNKLGMRNLRELKTLAQALDYLGSNQPSKCADLLAQRLKAIERACIEQHWNTAQFLELLPPEHSTLLEKDEELYLAKEFMLEQKARHYDQGRQKGRGWDQPKGRGKGKDDQKGEKGKGKDKGKKDTNKESWSRKGEKNHPASLLWIFGKKASVSTSVRRSTQGRSLWRWKNSSGACQESLDPW